MAALDSPISTYEDAFSVLDHGFVKLESYHGSDLSVVNSARVSVHVKREVLEEGDDKLIGFLMRERHGTPFEHNSFTFHVKAPIFVTREWQRHRIASYNELSGRYKEFKEMDFYVPHGNWRQQVGTPGHYTFEDWKGHAELAEGLLINHNKDCFDLYKHLIHMDVAKELARIVLPLSMYTEFYFTVNARSLMNFLSLRNSEQALLEIREYAKAVEALWAEKMPITAKAFIDNERIAP